MMFNKYIQYKKKLLNIMVVNHNVNIYFCENTALLFGNIKI